MVTSVHSRIIIGITILKRDSFHKYY